MDTRVLRALAFAAGLTLTFACLVASAQPAGAADIKLDNFKVVIGDNGDRFSAWNTTPNRVYVRVNGSDRRPHEHYFSNIASAYYVLNQDYGNPDYVEFTVAPADSRRMINARDAYYYWDNDRMGRGGTPLIVAYSDRSRAERYARMHPGEVLTYDDLTGRLSGWRNDNDTVIYWRGHDKWDNASWNRAWNSRWDGWTYDSDHGWWQKPHHNVAASHRHRRSGRHH